MVIRHADAGSRERWKGDDRLRPLTKKGRRQAKALVKQLAGRPLERILSSPYVRCVQTVEPLATERGLPIEETDALAEGAGLRSLLDLLDRLSGRPAALCTHGDIMYELLEELVRLGLVSPDGARYDKGAAWIVDEHEGRLLGARYMPVAKS